jgi:hypothetical protein
MLTLILTFVLMPMLVYSGLTLQQWLFRNCAENNESEWELYQQRYD